MRGSYFCYMPLHQKISWFKNTLSNEKPDEGWKAPLKALWYDAKGDWHRAHDLVDGFDGQIAASVHAYLHRKEGDEWNAGYWYRRAGKPFYEGALGDEWEELVKECLIRF